MARGSIFRRGTGYGFRVDLGIDAATGSRRQQSKQGFRTKREAERALSEAISDADAGTAVANSSLTVEAFIDEWLEIEKLRLKPTTWESYRVALGRTKRALGKQKLQSLTPRDVEQFYRKLSEKGGPKGKPLAPKTVVNNHVVLRKALSDAERLGYIVRNPAALARPPVAPHVEQQVWSSDELREFLDSTRDDRLRSLFVLLATTGMRRGEALGLRWSDVDLDSSQIHVSQTLTTVRYQPTLSTPKTKRSRRAIYLDATTIQSLRSHRTRQREERLAAGEVWNPDLNLVFTNEIGDELHPEWVTRHFVRLREAAAMPKIRLHDLRHTYATLALKAGVHPKVVSDRLGHASVGITLDLYSHVTPAIGRDAADVVAARIFGA